MLSLQSRDLNHIWHPCAQMKDYETFPPLVIERAEGAFFYTSEGRQVIDAISSWWCKSLGHCHPDIKQAVQKQLDSFEHIIMANTCNSTLVELSEKLAQLTPDLEKVFYADNGSTAVEIALKMSLQYNLQIGRKEKTGFLALENGYHGETILTLAAGDCELYSAPYASLMPLIPKITGIPYVSGINDPLWDNMGDDAWYNIQKQLDKHKDVLSGIVFEPLLQGAGGMKIYSADFLRRLKKWAVCNGVHLIADEIMTGFGRTGKYLACEYADITPDFVCLSKGLTAGWGPMAVVLTSNKIYDAFYDDYFSGKAFMHSNTYCGYPVAAAAALEAMKIYEREKTIKSVFKRSSDLLKRMKYVAEETNCLINLRSLGFVVAADIIDPSTGLPFLKELRIGYQCYKRAVQNGAFLRPLGDTLYFLPPLNISDSVLDYLVEITIKSLKEVIK